jgi:hypothetical protein
MDVLVSTVEKAFKSPDVIQRGNNAGLIIDFMEPDGMKKLIESGLQIVKQVTTEAGLAKQIKCVRLNYAGVGSDAESHAWNQDAVFVDSNLTVGISPSTFQLSSLPSGRGIFSVTSSKFKSIIFSFVGTPSLDQPRIE